MEYEIIGKPFPYILFKMNKGETILCEAGAMSWRTDYYNMGTIAGGVGKAFSRAFSGESMFVNKYTATSDNQELGISSSFLGNILAIEITSGQSIVVQKKAILALTEGINRQIKFKGPMKGLFAGEGFIMQEVSGQGTVFLEIDGDVREYELKSQEKLVLSTGFLLMMEETCTMDVERVGGLKNTFLGGEGIFNTVVTGPGKVIVQTSPIANLAASLRPFFPTNSGS